MSGGKRADEGVVIEQERTAANREVNSGRCSIYYIQQNEFAKRAMAVVAYGREDGYWVRTAVSVSTSLMVVGRCYGRGARLAQDLV